MNHFDDVVYARRGWELLARAFIADRLSGAYLVYGPDGSGRWAFAVALTALVNCESPLLAEGPPYARPCGTCSSCTRVFGLSFEGFLVAVPVPPHQNKHELAIDLTNEFVDRRRAEPFALTDSSDNTNIPVSIIREIRRSLSMRPGQIKRRVVLFYQMEQMRSLAADALLKLIEEPPDDTIILLVAHKPESVLPTIQSRTRKVRLGRLPDAVIESYLRDVHSCTPAAARLAARISQGSLGRALQAAGKTDDESGADRSMMLMLFRGLVKDDTPTIVAQLSEQIDSRDRGQAVELLRLWQLLIRDCAYFAVTGRQDGLVNIDFATEISRLSSAFTAAQTSSAMVDRIKNCLADLRLNVHIPGALLSLVLKLKQDLTMAQRLTPAGNR